MAEVKTELARELGRDALFEGFEYLDDLRESGRTNMWGAASFVQNELAWEGRAASDVVGLWMATFDPTVSLEYRVERALGEK